MALGISPIAGISGSFSCLVLGGILAPIQWRLIFIVSVPIGIFDTMWVYTKLEEIPRCANTKIDWPGNLTFALGLIAILVGVTYGIQPYGGSTMGWLSPMVVTTLIGGAASLFVFTQVERRSQNPMFRRALFKIRAFSAGSISSFLASVGRGGLMFMLVIWLPGIWLSLHGYGFARTPLWAGIAMLPLTFGFLIAGPISGALRPLRVSALRHGGHVGCRAPVLLARAVARQLQLLRVRWAHAQRSRPGTFAAPNRAGVMNSLPRQHRGVGSGMNSTFQNSGQVLSIGIFFTLMIIGRSSTLPASVFHGLTSVGVPTVDAPGRVPVAGVHPLRLLPRLQPPRAPLESARGREPALPHAPGARSALVLLVDHHETAP